MKSYSRLEQFALRRAHPVSIILNLTGFIWFVYFVWLNLWLEALVAVVLSKAACLLFVRALDYDRVGQTTLGKLALLHLHPFNIFLQATGVIGAIYGLWFHEVTAILAGVSLLTLGHLQGWGEVNPAFVQGGPFARFWNVYWSAQD